MLTRILNAEQRSALAKAAAFISSADLYAQVICEGGFHKKSDEEKILILKKIAESKREITIQCMELQTTHSSYFFEKIKDIEMEFRNTIESIGCNDILKYEQDISRYLDDPELFENSKSIDYKLEKVIDVFGVALNEILGESAKLEPEVRKAFLFELVYICVQDGTLSLMEKKLLKKVQEQEEVEQFLFDDLLEGAQRIYAEKKEIMDLILD